jgi:hypothetical protein
MPPASDEALANADSERQPTDSTTSRNPFTVARTLLDFLFRPFGDSLSLLAGLPSLSPLEALLVRTGLEGGDVDGGKRAGREVCGDSGESGGGR